MENDNKNDSLAQSRALTARPKTSLIARMAMLIGLLTLVSLIVISWYLSKTLLDERDTNRSFREQTLTSLQDMQSSMNALQNRDQQQQTTLSTIQQLSGGNLATWRFAEAKYLVQLAYYHLTFTRDVPAALALLQTAEQRIAAINDPTLYPIRQQLANNIVMLQAIPKVDLAGLLTRITALQSQTSQLPAIGLPSFKPVASAEDEAEVNAMSPLRKAIHQSWETLQKIVVIRRQDQPIQPLLSPEQQAYLHQNLQLILQQAQWAALRGREDVYQTSITQAQRWLDKYFVKNLPATKAYYVALSDLQKVNVQPPLPDLAPLARKIQQYNFTPPKSQDA